MSFKRSIVIPFLKVIAKSSFIGFQSRFADSKSIVDLSSEFLTTEPRYAKLFLPNSILPFYLA